MTERSLTELQKVFLEYQKRTGFNLTTREFCHKLGLRSTSTGHYYIQKLIDAGMVIKKGKQFQAVEPITEGSNVQSEAYK